jgi:hypothetical protein
MAGGICDESWTSEIACGICDIYVASEVAGGICDGTGDICDE